jgi:hypothetical protein
VAASVCSRDLDITTLQLWWGKPGFGCWVHMIKRCVRGRGFGAKNQKPSGRGSVFANDMRGALDLGSGDLVGLE